MKGIELCPLCDEPVGDDVGPAPLYTQEGPRAVHHQCMLREVMGGIGHLVAHEWWCEQKHDPDAGLTRRQSSLLVEAWVHVMGDNAFVPGRAE